MLLILSGGLLALTGGGSSRCGIFARTLSGGKRMLIGKYLTGITSDSSLFAPSMAWESFVRRGSSLYLKSKGPSIFFFKFSQK